MYSFIQSIPCSRKFGGYKKEYIFFNIPFLLLDFLTSAQIVVKITHIFINAYPSFIRNIGVHSPFSLFLCQSPSVSVKDSQMVVGILV